MDAVRGQSGLIHSSQLMFDVHEDHSSVIPTCEIPQDIIPPDHSTLCLLPAAVKLLVFIGKVQTVSTAQLNFYQRAVNKHTIIDSHSASCSSEPLEMLFVPTRIITLGILPGFISSTIRYNWAIVAPPKAITVVTQEVLKFESTMTKLSPSIRCDVPSGGCCRFTAGFEVAQLKQALGSVSGTPVKLYLNWLFFCTSTTRDTFFAGIFCILLSGALELPISGVVSLSPCLITVWVVLCPCLRTFHRVPSPRNLAHPCWRLVVQLSLSASSPFVPRLGHPRCH